MQFWSDAEKKEICRLYVSGKSAREIAKIYDNPMRRVTRNMMIGIIQRNLPKKRAEPPKGPLSAPSASFRPRSSNGAPKRPAAPKQAQFKPLPPAAEKLPLAPRSGQPIPLEALTSQTCRWPIGDPQHYEAFRFCGASCQLGDSYCGAHKKMAFAPSKPVRKIPDGVVSPARLLAKG